MKTQDVMKWKWGILIVLILTATVPGWSQQQAELTTADGESFGSSVSMSSDGNTALIGAFGNNQSQGAAYVFTRSGGVWSQQAELTAADGATDDYFGVSVSLSSDGNTALIGALHKTVGNNTLQGAAYVFRRSHSGSMWSQQAELTAADGAASDLFGYSVFLSGDGSTAVIGAYAKAVGNNTLQGTAYVFTGSGGVWSQQAELTAAGYYFGLSVSLSSDGNAALIGSGTDAYVFTRSGGPWSQQAKLSAPDSAVGDRFGYAVSLSSDGNTALIGASGNNQSQGAAYVFTRSGGVWSQQAELTAADGATNDYFGLSVSIRSGGNSALIGADGKTVGMQPNHGAAYVFTRSGGLWSQQAELTGGTEAAEFGSAVSVSSGDGDFALVGAPFSKGATYVLGPRLSVTAPVTAAVGTPFNLTVTALNWDNSIATNYLGTVHFTSTDSAAILPADSTLTNGTVTLGAILNTTGIQTITATDIATASIPGTSQGIAAGAGAGAQLTANNSFTGNNTFTEPIDGSITGNAGSVTNGVYLSGSYSDPPWITSLSGSKITGYVLNSANAVTANTADALAFAPTQCAPHMFATGIAANGNANCLQPASSSLSDSSNLVLNTQANTFAGGKQTLPASTHTYASLNLPNSGVAPTTPAMGDLWLTAADPHLMFLDKNNTAQGLAFLSDIASSSSNILSANNSFTGNNAFSQLIAASITGNAATVTNGVYTTGSYSDPPWMTSLSGSKVTGTVANAANAQSAVTAGIATTATTATTAANAASLGGVAAGDYARLDVGNTFTGDQSVTGNLSLTGTITGKVTIGSGGTPITEHLSILVNVNFPPLHPSSCASSSFTVTGAADGDTVALGIPNALMTLGGTPIYMAWVSAPSTVTIQACNLHLVSAQISAGTGSIRIDLWKH